MVPFSENNDIGILKMGYRYTVIQFGFSWSTGRKQTIVKFQKISKD